MIRYFLIIFFILAHRDMIAQKIEVDTLRGVEDTTRVIKGGRVITPEYYSQRFQPRKAILYSAVLPGMGQVYNKKYWKLPLVYGGFAYFTWTMLGYGNLYERTKQDLFEVVENPGTSPADGPNKGYNEDQLRSAAEYYRRQRDFFMILNGLWYLFQLVDAHVDAHLREFDLNPQLKVSVEPSTQRSNLYGQVSGLSVTLKF